MPVVSESSKARFARAFSCTHQYAAGLHHSVHRSLQKMLGQVGRQHLHPASDGALPYHGKESDVHAFGAAEEIVGNGWGDGRGH